MARIYKKRKLSSRRYRRRRVYKRRYGRRRNFARKVRRVVNRMAETKYNYSNFDLDLGGPTANPAQQLSFNIGNPGETQGPGEFNRIGNKLFYQKITIYVQIYCTSQTVSETWQPVSIFAFRRKDRNQTITYSDLVMITSAASQMITPIDYKNVKILWVKRFLLQPHRFVVNGTEVTVGTNKYYADRTVNQFKPSFRMMKKSFSINRIISFDTNQSTTCNENYTDVSLLIFSPVVQGGNQVFCKVGYKQTFKDI